MVCGSLFIAACATYTEPDATGRTPDPVGNDAGDNQGGNADTDAGGSSGNPSGGAAGKGGAGSTAGKTSGGGGGGAAEGGESGGGMGGAAGSSGGPATGGTGGAANGGAAGNSGAGGAGGAGAGGSGGAGGTSGAAGSGGSGGGAVNLITNAGFETNTTGWSVFGGGASIQTSADQAHGGTRSLLITGRTQTYQGPEYNVLSVITPGASYRLRLWGRLAASTPTGSLTATARYTCTGGTNAGDHFMQWVAATAASASSWTELTAVRTFATCPGGSLTGAWLYVESPTATLSYYIDDVVLTAE